MPKRPASPPLIDLTADSDDSSPQNLPDDASLIENDSQLKTLRNLVSDARKLVQHRHQLLTEATNTLRGLEEQLSTRASLLRRKADDAFQWGTTAFPWDPILFSAMQHVFRITSFRPLQREALNATLMRRDVYAILPTGAGKSLIYQLAAVVDRGLTLVVTPLVALSLDQQTALNALNIRACTLDSTTSKAEVKRIFADILPAKGNIQNSSRPRKKSRTVENNARIVATKPTKWLQDDMDTAILFVTPEQVACSKRLLSRLEMMYEAGHLSRIAIDEAHCCSSWGHDFRTDYRQLGILRRQCPDTPILALSATSNPKTTDDVCKILEIPRCVVFRGSIDRPNLYYEVVPKAAEDEIVITDLYDLITTQFPSQCGIIYVLSRKEASTYADKLCALGISAACYHSDMESNERSAVYTRWSAAQAQVVVATIAFGMGIDNQRVRFVIHATMATSLEAYYQESGRAGRDGRPAKCILLHRAKDFAKLSAFVADKGEERVRKMYEMYRYSSGWPLPGQSIDSVCRREMIAAGFGEKPPERNKQTNEGYCCDLCRNRKVGTMGEVVDVTKLARAAVRIVVYFTMTFPDEKLTLLALATDWANKGPKGQRMRGTEKALDRRVPMDTRLEILISLVLCGALEEYHRHSSYAMNAYVTAGQNVGVVFADDQPFFLRQQSSIVKILDDVSKKMGEQEAR